MAEQNSFELAASKPSFVWKHQKSIKNWSASTKNLNSKNSLNKTQELQAPKLFAPALDPGVARWFFHCPANEALEHATPRAANSNSPQGIGKAMSPMKMEISTAKSLPYTYPSYNNSKSTAGLTL